MYSQLDHADSYCCILDQHYTMPFRIKEGSHFMFMKDTYKKKNLNKILLEKKDWNSVQRQIAVYVCKMSMDDYSLQATVIIMLYRFKYFVILSL